jgi:putative nucleotidyltransferase with HDIG domain
MAMLEDSRAQAWTLLCEWTESDSLRRHMLAVEAAMRAYAPRFDGDVELWGLTGLLHDLDYERYPDLQTGHPRYALTELEARGYPPELVRAVASHATYLGVSRDTPMERALFAVDELCGFILACAYVRPEGLVGMTPKSVKKKLKTPAFAAAVSRDDITIGAAELGVDFDEHLRTVIAALADRRDELMPAAGSPAAEAATAAASPPAAHAATAAASPAADAASSQAGPA